MSRWLWLAVLAAGCGGLELDELNQASTQQCPSMTVEGVDVYQGDTPIVWSTVQSSGRVFAFSKASQGNYNTQSNFATNWSQLKTLGMLRGAYHYFDATIDGVAQADWFLQQITAAGGMLPGDLPPVLDLECPTSTVQNSAGNMCLGNGKNGWAPTATIIQRVWDWLGAVEAATGMKPIIYTYPSWFATFSWNDPALTQYPLWIAGSSMGCAQVPAPYTSAVFWQWNTTTGVPGIGSGTSAVDKDRFMGTIDQLNGFIAGDVVQPDGGAPKDAGGEKITLQTLLAGVPAEEAPDAAADLATRPPGHSDGGCGCDVGGAGGNLSAVIVALLLVAAVWRRRERERRGKLL